MDSLKLQVQGLVGKCKDPEVKKQMEKLAEKFKYSDPVSTGATVEVEKKIKEKLNELEATESEKISVSQIDKIGVLIDERNRICKASK